MAQFDEQIGAEQKDNGPATVEENTLESRSTERDPVLASVGEDPTPEAPAEPARAGGKIYSVLHVVGQRDGVDSEDTYEQVIDLSKNALPNLGYRILETRVSAHINPFKDPGTVWRLHRMFPEQDIVHAHGLHAAALSILATTGLPARVRPKIVVTVPRQRTGAVNDRDMTAGMLISSRATAVLGATASVVERFRSVPITERALLPVADAVTSLSPTRSRSEVHESLGVSDGTWLLASTAALTENNGLKTLLAAAREFSNRRPEFNVVLALAGDGSFKPALKDEVHEHDAPVLVVDESDAVDVLSAADVVLATDKLSVLDADQIMQLTRPIVSIGRLGRHRFGSAAAQVAEGDVDGVIDAVGALLANPQRRGVAAIEARSRVLGSAPSHDVVGQLVRVYREAVDGGRSRRAAKRKLARQSTGGNW
ncbi:glycosyltransferase [Spelaeicoccus albus]|uniref:Glycosyltransferase involved in cell wall biosynthesis n=1 Tax=Spelaeicoccus albus TaxID=1280376 RepID=A0A7Z0IJ56_9MICO|nr:glycosyltransferase [Spelaeicoccus albus]NYI69081.1 glycosyltransferase involved in cell wall biosynthesis [Spelaeicoccus albus]